MKKLVYRAFIQDDNGNWNVLSYDIYSDGSVAVPSLDRENENEINTLIRQKKENPEELSYIGDWPVGYDSNMQLISPEEDEDAFSTLCLLLHDIPPFEGYKIEYFGEGEPWIPNPEHDPYRIVN